MLKNTLKFFVFILLAFSSFLSQYAHADPCSYSGDTTISEDCTAGHISDDDSTITINSGVELDVHSSRLTIDDNIDITAFINNGYIDGDTMHSGAIKFHRENDIGSFINNGTVRLNGFKAFWITNDPTDASFSGHHGTFTNTGNWTSNGIRAFWNDLGTSWTSFTNSGTFTATGTRSIYLVGSGSIGTFTNSGTLTTDGSSTSTSNESFYLGSDFTITNFDNSGTWALGTGTKGASLNGTITTLTNTGTISGTLNNSGTITTLTNTGTISGTLNNSGTITTFNNDGVVTYQSALPVNYNIIINSTSDFGKLNVTSGSGSTSFGIHSSSSVSNDTRYENIFTGLTVSDISNTSGTYGGFSWLLRNTSGTNWDLIFGNPAPSSAVTLASIRSSRDGVASYFSGFALTTNYANMNSYECSLFNQDGGCFSIGGRYSDVNSINNSDSSSFASVAVGGFKINDNYRVTGFVDQQVNSSTPDDIKVKNKGPMLGMRLVWNQYPDQQGYQVKVANAYQSKDINITRSATNDVTGDAIVGRGDTKVQVESYIAEVSYHFGDGIKTSYRPYFAMRRATIKQDGYTETGVNHPLTFNTLEDKSTTMIIGMKSKYKLNKRITLNGTLGVEHDLRSSVDKIKATSSSIGELTSVDLNTNINKTRPVLTLGASCNIGLNQSISVQTQYQELSHTSTSGKTAYLSYNVRF